MENLLPGQKTFLLTGLAILLGVLLNRGWIPQEVHDWIMASPDEALSVSLIGFGVVAGWFRMLTNKFQGLTALGKEVE